MKINNPFMPGTERSVSSKFLSRIKMRTYYGYDIFTSSFRGIYFEQSPKKLPQSCSTNNVQV